MSQLYQECGRIISRVIAGTGSVKSLCLNSRNRAKKKLYAIVFNVLQNYQSLQKIAEEADLEPSPLICVHLYELLYRGALHTGGPLKAKLLSLKPRLLALKEQHAATTPTTSRLPLYVRINTLKTEDPVAVIRQLQTDFPGQFSGDPHVNYLLRFPPSTNFSEYPLYRSGCLILQDKASCLPALALDPPAGATVLDACSAPGNKTLHLAALMGNTGRVLAVERDRKRFNRLKGSVKRHGAGNITALCADFLQIRPTESPYSEVTHLLLDPSCSGSGMVSEALVGRFRPVDGERVKALARTQSQLLSHALSFPALQRVVYSTCSVHEEENEAVVRGALENHPGWEVVPVLPDWERRGLDGMEGAVRCSPEDGTNGFFLACLQKKRKVGSGAGTVVPQTVFSVCHLERRFKLRGPYKYPYKFVAI